MTEMPCAADLPIATSNASVIADLAFAEAWMKGDVVWPGAILRIRQMIRANPALAVTARPQASRRPSLG